MASVATSCGTPNASEICTRHCNLTCGLGWNISINVDSLLSLQRAPAYLLGDPLVTRI